MSSEENRHTEYDLGERQHSANRYLDGNISPEDWSARGEAEVSVMVEQDLERRIEQMRSEEISLNLRNTTGPAISVSPELALRAGIPAEKASSKLGKGILGLLSRLH